jgi:hypothetical protein
MTQIIDLAAARQRLETPRSNPILEALDALALALADHEHQWSAREAELYETAVTYLSGGYTGSGSSA